MNLAAFDPLHASFGAEILGVDLPRGRRRDVRRNRAGVASLQHPPVPQRRRGRRTSTSRSRGASVPCTSWSRRSSTCPAIRKSSSSPTPRRTTSRSASSAPAGVAFRRRGQGPAQCGLVHPRDGAAAGRQRHDVRRHVRRVQRAARRRAPEDHGPQRVLLAARASTRCITRISGPCRKRRKRRDRTYGTRSRASIRTPAGRRST